MAAKPPLRQENQQGSVSLTAFLDGLRATHEKTTAFHARHGASELTSFLSRAGLSLEEMTPRDFVRFKEATLERERRGEVPRWKARGALVGARCYLRHLLSVGALDGADFYFLAHASPRFEKHASGDPFAPLLAQSRIFGARHLSPATRGAYQRGALSLLLFLGKRHKTLPDLTSEEWEEFRQWTLRRGPGGTGERAQDSARMLLAGARAYLQEKQRSGLVRKDLCFERPIHRVPPPPLCQRLAGLPSVLAGAMAAAGLGPTTRAGYARALRDFLLWLEEQGITELSEVTREVMTAFSLHLQGKTTRKGAPYAATSVAGILAGLRFFFTWLVKTGVLLTDPMAHLGRPRKPRRLPRPLKVIEVRRLLASLSKTTLGLRDQAILELLYGTGMRRGELARLDLSDLDLEQRSLLIRCGKGSKDRVVPLGKKAQQALLDYLDFSRGKLLRSETGAVFLSALGRRLSREQVTKHVRKLGQRLGLDVYPHRLRHSCASHLLRGRADIRHIQRLLGHKSLQTTEVYTRVEVADLRAVIQRCHPRERPR